MKKQILLLIIFSIITTGAWAQSTDTTFVTEQENILRLGIFEIEYEIALAPKTTLVTQAGIAFSAGFRSRRVGWVFDYRPNASISLRYYYNLQKRAATGRNTKYYSGNYITFVSKAYFEVLTNEYEKNEYFFGPAWGMQRDVGHRFQIGVQLGLGMGGPIDNLKIAPLIGFNLGYRIN